MRSPCEQSFQSLHLVQEIPIAGVEIMNLPPNLTVPGLKEGDEVVILTIPKPVSNPVDGGAWPHSGDQIQFDDLSSASLCRPGLKFNVEPVEIILAGTDAAVEESKKSEFELLLTSMSCFAVADMHLKSFKVYEAEHEAAATGKKMPTRIYKLRTRVAVVLPRDIASDCVQSFKSWVNGGFMKQLLPEVQMSFTSFADSIEKTPNPFCLMQERTESGLGIDALLAIDAVFQFNSCKSRWPALGDLDDAKDVAELADGISTARTSAPNAGDLCYAQKVEWGFCQGEPRDLDKARVRLFAQFFEAELVGFCSFLGGVVAQEAMKKIGKFTPISGWLIHEDYDLVRASEVSTMRTPLFGSRFDYQISVLGKDFQSRIGSQKVFLVGCGALGCEYMKALALMGAGSGHGGKVTVVDMDTIEVSNLSRQFLFREDDVKHFKSTTAARVVKSWVPSMNVEALQARVGPDSEDFFNDDFWQNIDVCWNALDNVEARKYTDARCLMFGKPLLESGTLGTKNNSEVALPFVTQSYSDGGDGAGQENAIAMCTLRSFPYLPLHCIEMAKQQYFSELFQFGPQLYETFRRDPSEFFDQIEAMKEPKERLKFLQYVKCQIQSQQSGSVDFGLCIRMAFDGMTDYFRNGILNVIHMADAAEKRDSKPFWTGAKRKPRALEWGAHVSDPQQRAIAMEFLYATANMNAYVWGIEPIRNRGTFESLVASLKLEQSPWTLSVDSVTLEECILCVFFVAVTQTFSCYAHIFIAAWVRSSTRFICRRSVSD
jgi:ubiquitin-activating enzyme E1